jgi:1-acyl-sn-glycerol-3-phosphate acyltransferase
MSESKPQTSTKHDTYAFLETAGNLFIWLMGGLYVRGADRVPKHGSVLLVSNHASLLDPVAIGVATPRRVLFMTKAELFKIKLLGWLLDGVDCFPVKRGSADRGAFKLAIQRLAEGRCLCIFPEGTRSPDGKLQSPEPGAATLGMRMGVQLVPVYVKGSFEILGVGRPLRRGRIDVIFGDPFSFEKGIDKDVAGQVLMSKIQELADNPDRDPAFVIRPHRFSKPSERVDSNNSL